MNIRLALIGNSASTVPFDLNSNCALIQSLTKRLFQSGSKDLCFISSSDCVDIGQVGLIFFSISTNSYCFILAISFTNSM